MKRVGENHRPDHGGAEREPGPSGRGRHGTEPSPEHRSPPDQARLRALALAHLARFDTTEAGLRRVLDRAIERWVRAAVRGGTEPDAAADLAASARVAVGPTVRALVEADLLDDRRFAERRAALDRSNGRSARASQARLAAKGVAPALAAAVTGRDDDAELAAALHLLRRRRLGPFGSDDGTAFDPAERHRRTLATLARAGFAGAIARRALGLARADAEALLAAPRE